MTAQTLESVFRPTPPQQRFLQSKAFIRAYGGAVGGGKSRAMCEAIFDYALDHPGLTALIARDTHTSIITSTKKTMLEQVIPADERIIVRTKASGGEDYIELFNGSTIHFIGMDNPLRWYSSEISIFALDEAQELNNIEAEKVIVLLNRLRERCRDCIRSGKTECEHMPHKAMFSFNPSGPSHWLRKWFILEAEQTDYGFYKPKFFLPEATEPIGDAEFVRALPADNPYLQKEYVRRLHALPPHLRRRYLEGMWENFDGKSFFDAEALTFYDRLSLSERPIMQGTTEGDVVLDAALRRMGHDAKTAGIKVKTGHGALQVWRRPVGDTRDGDGNIVPAHRYVMGVDVSSGGSHDYSAIQVVDIDAFEQVAEWQGKLTPTEVAMEAYRIGRIFNNALAAVEITGGYGFSTEQEMRRMRYPRMYTEQVRNRLTKQITDRVGWNTSTANRALMLDTLERALREREFGLYSPRTVTELGSFVYRIKKDESFGKPEAQASENDDLVIALAIAVTIAAQRPKQLRTQKSTKKYKHWLALGNA